MNRRNFLTTLAAIPLVPFKPVPKQDDILFFIKMRENSFVNNPRSSTIIDGIPYHYNDGTPGEWLGFKRA